ncbi:MAG: helix-turn-helix domain-containing protein [Natronosporangium sp.]
MSQVTTVLRVGLRLVHDGDVFTVVEIAGRRLLLRNGSGQVRQVEVGWLLSHPTTRVAEAAEELAGTASSVVLGSLDTAAEEELADQVGHVREVVTGYRLGSVELAADGEPRAEYRPGTAMMDRYRAKATELGVGVSTVRRWVAAFRAQGPAGLARQGGGPRVGPLGRVDARWLEMCQVVLGERVSASRPTRAIVLAEVEARLAERYGAGVVPVPGKTTGYELLRELSRGSNAFAGSTKGKRSIADRPQGVYGRLRATRPGEYVLLDSTRLDVFAMEPVTCRWVQAELTAAMDLYSRSITGLRLTPVSTKAVDVAAVLFETLRPRTDTSAEAGGGLPYHGVPQAVVVDAGKLVDGSGRALLPSVAAETIVYDHGQIYLSRNVESVCARFEISLQPARPRTPTDKSPLERWFRSLADGLLVALPGYKGADVHSRGLDVEEQAFFFLDEMAAVIREWVGLVYHCRPHGGLCVPEVPGLAVCPLEMFEHGIRRAGYLSIPNHPDLAYEFLPVVWTSIQHYGVQVNTLRYHGSALIPYRNRRSPFGGVHAGKWPIAVDPGDVRQVYFQDPADHRWHRLEWEHAADLNRPLSSEALVYARRLAATSGRFPDLRRTLVELLERWGAGLTRSAAERRMAIRLSEQRLRLVGDSAPAADTAAEVSSLPSVRRLTAISDGITTDPPAPASDRPAPPLQVVPSGDDAGPGGDDDTDQECDADAPTCGEGEDDFYADVMDSA